MLPLILLALLAGPAPELRIVGDTRIKPHRIARLRAENAPAGAALLWRYDRKKLDGGRNGNELWLTGPPGEHAIELLAIRLDKEGNTLASEASATLVIEGDATSPPAKPDPRSALGRLRIGTTGCTATVIGPRRGDGRWDILTAAHCIPAGRKSGTVTMPDGKALAVTLQMRETTSDLAWFATDEKVDSLPFALLATKASEAGAAIWHAGFGVDKPGNVEKGKVLAGENASRQISMELSVSSGDSGGGIFREDTGELIAVVCCTRSIGKLATMYGGSSMRAIELRPGAMKHPTLDLSAFGWDGSPVAQASRPDVLK